MMMMMKQEQTAPNTGTTCKCWWCGKDECRNYYKELCFACTNNIASKMLPGVMGQGKYDKDRVYWDKLKTLVTEVGVPPSD